MTQLLKLPIESCRRIYRGKRYHKSPTAAEIEMANQLRQANALSISFLRSLAAQPDRNYLQQRNCAYSPFGSILGL